ncbi:MAG TPA: hypothetical protein ENG03_05465 [Thioploca sp.]|nr:MAG: hypothetical protein DRR19_10300 [Gammaproteobacteria bacterium]HDN26533.1 hypothetical protein [Thioploca sp.]
MPINHIVYTTLISLLILMPATHANVTTLDWRNFKTAPTTLALTSPTQTLVIQADDLDLGQLTFPKPHTQNTPMNVVLIADTLRLSQLATFELSNPHGVGGNLLILARQIVVGEDGVLSFRTIGAPCGNLLIFYGTTSFNARTKPVEAGARFQFVTQQLHQATFSRGPEKFNPANVIDKKRVFRQMSVDILQDKVIRQPTWAPEYPKAFKRGTALKGAVWFTCASYTANRSEFICSQAVGASAKYVPNAARLDLSHWIIAQLEKLKKPVDMLVLFGGRNKLAAHLQPLKTLMMMGADLIVDSDRKRYRQLVIELINLLPSPEITVAPVILGNPMMGEEQVVQFFIKNYENEDVFCSSIRVRARVADRDGRFVAWHNVIARDVVIPAGSLTTQQEASKEILNAFKQQFEQPRIVDLDKASYRCQPKWLSTIQP